MVKIIKQTDEKDVVEVTVGKTPYNIYIGDVLADLTEFLGRSKYRSVKIITDQNVEQAGHLETVLKAVHAADKKASFGVLKAGEQFKHANYLPEMVRAIDDPNFDRRGVVIALGGGVIGDTAGLMAADYLRGVALIQMPTTPLSCADSSIGGKVGIDTDQGKNRWGSFKQPSAVFEHITFFNSLNTPGLRHYGYDSGWAETLKHAGISNGYHMSLAGEQLPFIDFIDANLNGITSFDNRVIRHAMLRNAIIKGNIVETDEKEQGIRVCLNLGHTFGHALESYMNNIYLREDSTGASVFPHGDAVGIGVNFAARLSLLLGTGLKEAEIVRQESMYQVLGIMTRLPSEARLGFDSIYGMMAADKKAILGSPQFLLQDRLGSVMKIAEAQPDGTLAPGGYFLQPVKREMLKQAFDLIQ